MKISIFLPAECRRQGWVGRKLFVFLPCFHIRSKGFCKIEYCPQPNNLAVRVFVTYYSYVCEFLLSSKLSTLPPHSISISLSFHHPLLHSHYSRQSTGKTTSAADTRTAPRPLIMASTTRYALDVNGSSLKIPSLRLSYNLYPMP